MSSKKTQSLRQRTPPTALPRPARQLTETLQFMRVLWAMVHAMDTASKRMARDHGVTGPQRLVLRMVGMSPGISAGNLAAVLHVDPSTLTGVLQRLVQQRLLTRSEDATDRRRATLYLTARGRQLNTIKRGTIEAAVAAALQTARRDERDAACRVLASLTEHLERAPRAQPDRVPVPSSLPPSVRRGPRGYTGPS